MTAPEHSPEQKPIVDEPAANQPSTSARPGKKIADMFGRIVKVYDPLNRLFSLGLDQHWRSCLAETALLGVRNVPAPHVLDIAAGTLDVAVKLTRFRPDCKVTALDFCLPMLERGKGKIGKAAITPVQADARRLPLPDNCANAVTMAFGIRNITPREDALREMYRVLLPGGRLCLLEFSPPEKGLLCGLYNVYLKTVLPLAGRFFSGESAYAYLVQSIFNFPGPSVLATELRKAGFARVYHVPLTSGIVRLHVGEKA